MKKSSLIIKTREIYVEGSCIQKRVRFIMGVNLVLYSINPNCLNYTNQFWGMVAK